MYAKLVFPAGTENSKITRDIVRTIVNSTGAGGSTVGVLEFVDAGQSSIDDTLAPAAWSLASGSIPTGAIVEQDKVYYLTCPHTESAVNKYAWVGPTIPDSGAGSFTAADNKVYSGVGMGIVTEFGLGNQKDFCRLTPASYTASSSYASYARVGGALYSDDITVFVIADEKRLIIVGEAGGYTPGARYLAIAEMPSTVETDTLAARAPQAFVFGGDNNVATVSAFFQGTSVTMYNQTSMGFVASRQLMGIVMVDAFHNYALNEDVKYAAFASDIDVVFPTTPQQMLLATSYEFGVEMCDVNQDATTTSNEGTHAHQCFFGSYDAVDEGWAGQNCGVLGSYGWQTRDDYNDARKHVDAAGNRVNKIVPVAFQCGFQGNYYDLSAMGGIFKGNTAYFRAPAAEVTAGNGDKYVLCKTGTIYGNLGSVGFKVV